jgi:hypothetical protein
METMEQALVKLETFGFLVEELVWALQGVALVQV